MQNGTFTLGHSPDPDDAFMFYGLAKRLVPTHGFRFEHVLQDIQTLNERATRGELDISAISIHAYAYMSDRYALLPSGASMGDGYGPMLVAKQLFSRDEIAQRRIAVPGTMTSAFLALQLWLNRSAREFNYVVVPFDQIFEAIGSGAADVGLIIHEGQLTFGNEGLALCADLGVWWGDENDGLPLPLGGNVIHKRFQPVLRKMIADILTASIRFSLEHRADAVTYAVQFARDMGADLADKFVGMYVNHWTLDYGEKGKESIQRFLRMAHERGAHPPPAGPGVCGLIPGEFVFMRENPPSTQAGWKRCPTPRLRLRISAAAETAVRAGHPWIYEESVLEQNREGTLGEFAVVFDRQDEFLAIGLFDCESPLRVRVLHVGKPIPVDHDWWVQRLRHSISRRKGLFDAQSNGYRWINGESDGWPGLILDRYADTLVLKLYTAAWLPRLEEVIAIIRAELDPEHTVLRLSRNIQSVAQREFSRTDGQALLGTSDRPVVFLETGQRFEADVQRGQKTGFFLDQRENRRLVEPLARGREVLNAFSFSGGFSLYAARGGATSVTDLDISAHALESARRNFGLNASESAAKMCEHITIQADAFAWLEKNRSRKFDLVILDPPSLAKREADRAGALRAYANLAGNAIASLRPDGILVAASCSAHVSAGEFFEAIRKSALNSRRKFVELRTTGHPPDHPATFPEAHYLKCIFLRLLM